MDRPVLPALKKTQKIMEVRKGGEEEGGNGSLTAHISKQLLGTKCHLTFTPNKKNPKKTKTKI